MIKIKKKIFKLYRETFWSLEKQAKAAGVTIGESNFIASHFWSSEPYLIKIGSHCAITAGVKIFTHGGARSVRRWYPKFDIFGKVTIGDYVYIGTSSLIMPGVTIGNNVLIAAGSIITKSIPSNVVVAGNPAKYVCSIEEYLDRNMKYNTDTKGLSNEKKKELLLSLDESKFIHKSLLKTQ